MERPSRPPRPAHRRPTVEEIDAERRMFVRDQLALSRESFQSIKQLSVYCGTWNVNAKKPHQERELSGDLTEWLIKGFLGNSSYQDGSGDDSSAEELSPDEPRCPDVYAIGFQEIVDLNAQNLLVSHHDHQPWEELIEETLSRLPVQYHRLDSVTLVGLHLVIYVNQSILPRIRHVSTTSVGTGIMVSLAGKQKYLFPLTCDVCRASPETRVVFSADSSMTAPRSALSTRTSPLTRTRSPLEMPTTTRSYDERPSHCPPA